jgi:dTDP-4-amino-4,6-dideoxygalactose transaminase
MNVQFGNPRIQTSIQISREINAIIDSGWVSIGEYVDAVESHFRKLTGVRHAIACSSATTGLIIAVKAAGWKDKGVALPTFTWPSTLYALQCNNNTPVFCDIDRNTWLPNYPNSHSVEKVIAVDMFGSSAEHCDLVKRINPNDVIYDAAHGYGLSGLGKRGLAEVVSLSFTKVVTAMEGGVILTDDDQLAEIAIELRRLSGRMGEINALMCLESINMYRPNETIDVINKYKKHITVPHKCQDIVNDTNNSVFSVLFESTPVRDAIRIALARAYIETKVYYDPLKKGFPHTEDVYSRILSLPIHKGVSAWQDSIIKIINTAGRGAKTPGKEFLTQ